MSAPSFAQLEQFEYLLKTRPASLFGPFAPEHVYHYTTAAGFSGILADGALRATNFSFLNDTSEIQFGHDLVRRLLHQHLGYHSGGNALFLRAILDQLTIETLSEVYVSCFSALRDDLSQWRAYGTSAVERYSIGFEARQLEEFASQDAGAAYASVLYDESAQNARVTETILKALRAFQQEPNRADVLAPFALTTAKYLARMLPVLKDGSYSRESEWRLIVWRKRGAHAPLFDTTRGFLRPYLLVKIADVLPVHDVCVLAPNRSERACKAADMQLETAGLQHVKSYASRIPFAE